MSQDAHLNLCYRNDANKIVEQELVIILENGTEPTPVRAIRRPEPKLHSPVHVPFPPAINAASLIRINKEGALLARCTNKFLIYRNQFAKEVRTQGYNLSMSEVSCLAAQAWKREPNHVIRKYSDIAQEVKWLHKQLSRSGSKKGKKTSNSLMFSDSSLLDSQTKKIKSKNKQDQLTRFSTVISNVCHNQHVHDYSQQEYHQKLSPTPLTPDYYSSTSSYPSPSEQYSVKIGDVINDGSVSENYQYNNLALPFMDMTNYCTDQFAMANDWIYLQYLQDI
ncbi:9523_t:CDS:1 [Scutellospora calospora]|uniref:9523_t:CDS:1 n=1 Tax=Scutellospora calospora TaxID=85575 RepID=A0ACA9KM69_9GLOM|nr:9523_t:CDS:1 [Scutellospora calospora]